ncbi:MAG: NAD(P)-dependent glycerol-3-phosphate dehydrogenase [Deltaproteobacteria bacterium]|nr:NAD(P)-dependent glycerol-3-phosphate dehydrogenase [Deltaproteobacteria bacterium]
MSHAAVIGAGSWGTALSRVLADKGETVRLWGRDPGHTDEIERTRQNARYLPGVELPESVEATSDLDRAVRGADLVLLVIPTHTIREVARKIRTIGVAPGAPVVCASKGIENDTLMLISEVLAQELPEAADRLAYLSGPSFAKEVVRGLPAAVVMASNDGALADVLQRRFSSERLRCYANTDVVGVEMGGALKNVIAIAAGAVDGLELGHNARAAVITRGLAEIARAAMVKGGSALTIAGLAGLGDLVLTCTGEASRNRTVGYEMGRGRTLDDVLGSMNQVAEGVRTAKSARDLSIKLGIDMPISTEVYRVLYENKPVKQAVYDLMTRTLVREW